MLVDHQGPPGCAAPGQELSGIEHLTGQELVLSRTADKWATYDNQNFVYDIRSRKLLSHFSYPPFFAARVVRGRNGSQFVMAGTHRLLLVDIDAATGEPQKIAEFRDRFANPFVAAERGYVDGVIEPRETRARVIRALRMLENKVDTMPKKKHGNIPL
jgi:hypothetical protein